MCFAFAAMRRLAAAGLAALSLSAGAQTFQVSIDTTPLAGAEGFLAFDLLQGDASTVNEVVVSLFVTSSSLPAPGSALGDVTGQLPSSVTLRSSGFFNEYLQPVVFGAGVTTFQLSLTHAHLDGNIPDSFAIFLLDAAFNPYATSDPNGADALLVFDPVLTIVPQIFTSDFAVATVVPEPATVLLMLAGLATLGGALRTRRQAAPAASDAS